MTSGASVMETVEPLEVSISLVLVSECTTTQTGKGACAELSKAQIVVDATL